MVLFDLVQARHNIQCNILQELNNEVIAIKVAAEDMIECATNIKGQGYSNFINSREVFLSKIDELHNQIVSCIDINSCTH